MPNSQKEFTSLTLFLNLLSQSKMSVQRLSQLLSTLNVKENENVLLMRRLTHLLLNLLQGKEGSWPMF